jgi:hypothetical protein
MIGVAMLVTFAIWKSLSFEAKCFNLFLGAIAVFEAILYLIWRVSAVRARTTDLSATGFDPRHVPVAFNMILGAIIVAASSVLFAFGVMDKPHSVLVWGAASFAGCMAGGGLIAAGWNGYRRIEGASHLVEEQLGWSLVDWCVVVFGIVGVFSTAIGPVLSKWLAWESAFLTMLVGGIMTAQAVLFLVMRTLLRRAAHQEAVLEDGSDR